MKYERLENLKDFRWYEASSSCTVVLGDLPKAEEREEPADVDGDQE